LSGSEILKKKKIKFYFKSIKKLQGIILTKAVIKIFRSKYQTSLQKNGLSLYFFFKKFSKKLSLQDYRRRLFFREKENRLAQKRFYSELRRRKRRFSAKRSFRPYYGVKIL